MRPPEKFESERLILRRPVLQDAEPLFHACTSSAIIPQYMTWVKHRHVSETEDFVKDLLNNWEEGKRFEYMIDEPRDPGKPIGCIRLSIKKHVADFGYMLSESHWGKGYMPEALSVLIDWSLNQPDIYRAQAVCDVDNAASARVMAKAGMILEGTLRRYIIHPNMSDEPRDVLIYARCK